MNEKYFLSIVLAFVITALIVSSAFLFYPHAKLPLANSFGELSVPASDRFRLVYDQLGILPLPPAVERQQIIQQGLEQLGREPCYRDAIAQLSDGLLQAGYPRESATSLLRFTDRCPGSVFLLAGAYQALTTISDSSGALQVADKLTKEYPARSTYRYWRALAYDGLRDHQRALADYRDAVQLAGDLKTVSGDAFYNLSRMYAALGRYCDAITPMQTYIYLDPAERRTPQTVKIIADYADQGHCDPHFARGSARVPFVGSADVHTLAVSINGVIGNFILDTGATYVSVTSKFAENSKVSREAGNQTSMKTVGGSQIAEMGHANTTLWEKPKRSMSSWR
jgi:tetratricopeptide (TPR) repeat protein